MPPGMRKSLSSGAIRSYDNRSLYPCHHSPLYGWEQDPRSRDQICKFHPLIYGPLCFRVLLYFPVRKILINAD
jgi:hypothetical protein